MTVSAAAILVALAGALHWKHKAPRFVAWALFFAGLGLAGLIASYLGVLTHLSVLGIGLAAPLAVFALVIFWHEATGKGTHHRVRTPIVALLLGTLLVSLGGSAGNAIRSAVGQAGSGVNNLTSQVGGGR